jgi:hypothetical protein
MKADNFIHNLNTGVQRKVDVDEKRRNIRGRLEGLVSAKGRDISSPFLDHGSAV